jgi:YidC/Oxa1 family membrane protein insertase
VAGNEAGGAVSPLEPRWRRPRPAEEVEIVRETVLGWFESVLSFLHGIFEPIFGIHSWGWAIIALTLIVRVALLPLAIKQTRSMRAMQALQPQMKELQKKYKVDRDLLKKDPEQYKAKKAKLNEEMMGLYQREGANPAASCLPLLAQAPIFLALFWTLRGMDELIGAEFYFFTTVGEGGLEQLVSQAGWPGWLLILLMSGTMFWSQRQMMARNAATAVADNPMAQQQKILLYVMPVFLAFISFNFPMGILLYWVTTNIWQVAQQAIILREVQHEVETGEIVNKPGGAAAKQTRKRSKPEPDGAKDEGGSTRRSPGASSGRKPADDAPPSDDGIVPTDGAGEGPTAPLDRSNGRSDEAPGGPADPIERPRKRDHLPKRGGGTRP